MKPTFRCKCNESNICFLCYQSLFQPKIVINFLECIPPSSSTPQRIEIMFIFVVFHNLFGFFPIMLYDTLLFTTVLLKMCVLDRKHFSPAFKVNFWETPIRIKFLTSIHIDLLCKKIYQYVTGIWNQFAMYFICGSSLLWIALKLWITDIVSE